MKFGFIAKHRGTWPVRWLCAALGVSRSGFHGWLTRPRSARAQADEVLTAKVRASFVASSRTSVVSRASPLKNVIRTPRGITGLYVPRPHGDLPTRKRRAMIDRMIERCG